MTTSAGLLVFRIAPSGAVEVLLVHPGGPFWARKDAGAWSVPKGEYGPDEDPYLAARRELEEETGMVAPDAVPIDLGEIRQRGGKRVRVWALEGDFDVSRARSNVFELEWPPRSGVTREFPEVDRVEWCSIEAAKVRLLASQSELIDRLVEALPLR